MLTETLQDRHSAITVSELASMLNISRRQLYKMAAANRIPHLKIGASVRFDPDAIREWLHDKTLLPQRRPPASARPNRARTARIA
ncbi:MAG: helix-turn-helix domain-containing protein [Edaphobacter sp.]